MIKTTYNSFELLYLYVENIRCFKSQEFTFTAEYKIEYDKKYRKLTIKEKHDKDYLKDFFGTHISNINVIVGKNGSGKSSILELIGNDELDRELILNINNPSQDNNQHYFLVFKTNNNHFYIEGYNYCLNVINNTILSNNLEYIDNHFSFIFNEKEKQILYKNTDPSSKEYSFENKTEDDVLKKYAKENSIIVYEKEKRNRLEMTKGLPMLSRCYQYSNVQNRKYATLYKLLTSKYDFIKLFTTDIDISLTIGISCLEESIIAEILLNKIHQTIEVEDNNYINLIINWISSFIIKINKLCKNNQTFLNSNQSVIIKDLKKAEKDLDYLVSLIKSATDDILGFNILDYNKIFIIIEDLKNEITSIIYNFYNLFQNETNNKVNISTKIKNMTNSLKTLKELINDLMIDDIITDDNYIVLIERHFYNILVNLYDIFENIEKYNHILTVIKTVTNRDNNSLNNLNDCIKLIEDIISKIINFSLPPYEKNSGFYPQWPNDLKIKFINLIFKSSELPKDTIKTDIFYKFEFKINQTQDFNNKIYNFLQAYDDFISIFYDNLFNINFGHNLSEGELELLFKTINIFEILEKNINTTPIILLDEPDKSLHLEWSRIYINCLINMINELSNKKNLKPQFIITTHSPFMLSDIPKEYINAIDIVINNDGEHIRKVIKPKKSFACNYYDMIKGSFFLNDTIGGFASEKIRNIHKILSRNLNDIQNHKITQEDVINELKNNVNIDSETKLQNVIKCIDEPIIKSQLQYIWNELCKYWSKDISNLINQLNEEEKRSIYKLLSNELNENK